MLGQILMVIGSDDVRLDHCQDTGVGKGKYYSCNIPLRDGITDDAYKDIFEPVNPRHASRQLADLLWSDD